MVRPRGRGDHPIAARVVTGTGASLAVPTVAVMLLGLAAVTAQAQPEPQPSDSSARLELGEALEIRVAPHHTGFPDAARLPDGTILVVYREGRGHVGEDGRIAIQRGSADGGGWSAPEVAVDTPGVDDRDPSLTITPDGTVLLSGFTRHPRGDVADRLVTYGVWLARSEDGGHTFSPPRRVDGGGPLDEPARLDADSGAWVTSTGDPIQVVAVTSPLVMVDTGGGGQWRIPVYGGAARPDWNHQPRSRVGFLVSQDDGEHWHWEGLRPELSPEIWLQEPFFVELADGSWLVQVRSADGDNPVAGRQPLRQARSDDEGRSWSEWRALAIQGHAPYLVEPRPGLLISAFRRVSEALDHAWVSLAISLDGGRSWSEPPLDLHDCGDADCGYPSLVALDASRLLVVYYVVDDAGGRILGRVLRLTGG